MGVQHLRFCVQGLRVQGLNPKPDLPGDSAGSLLGLREGSEEALQGPNTNRCGRFQRSYLGRDWQ